MNRKLIGLMSTLCLVLVLTVVPLISACAPEEEVAPPTLPVGPTGELVVLEATLAREVWALDVGGSTDHYFLGITNETLFGNPLEGDEPRYQPSLAERWEVSEDGLTWDFYLRQGIQFNEGWGEFTAEDVLFSFLEVGKAGSTNAYAQPLRIGDGGGVERYEIIDPYHLRMHLTDVNARMEFLLTGPDVAMVSKEYYEAVGHDYAMMHPIGTGPWRLIEHEPAGYIKYEAVENHWRQTPEFKYLTIKGVPELSARLAMLKTGAADICIIPPEHKADLEAFGIEVKRLVGLGNVLLAIGGIVLPTREGYDPTCPWVPHQDEPEAVAGDDWGEVIGGSEWNQRALKVRMAMFHAIDRQAIIDKIFYGEAVLGPIRCWAPYGSMWTRPEWKPCPYDPELARQLLVEAGYPDGFEVQFQLLPMTPQPSIMDVGEAVCRYWEAIGLTVKRNSTEYVVQRPFYAGRASAWRVMPVGWPTYTEPWMGFPTSHYTKAAFNQGFESLELDKLVEKCLRTPDFEGRMEATLELGDWVYERYLVIDIALTNQLFALSPKVGDFPLVIPPYRFYYLKNLWGVTRAE